MSFSRYFRRRRWDQERSRELEAYLELETTNNIARGMSPEESRYAARKKLGNPTLIREEIYHMNTLQFIETLWQDLRYGARLLRLNLGFTVVAVASLALGIGANTAIFQLLDAVRLRALPVKNPQELATVQIANFHGSCCSFNTRYSHFTYAQWEQIRDHQQAFSGIMAWSSYLFNLSVGGETRYAEVLMVSGDFFGVLGVPPALGRVLTPADDHHGCGSPGAVISDAFWHREYGADPSVVGKKLTVSGYPFEVVGVTPPGFFGVEVGRGFDVSIPLCGEAIVQGEYSVINKQWGWWLASMGRLKPGWTLARATAHLNSISPGIFQTTLPSNFKGETAEDYLGFKLAALPGDSGFSRLRTEYSDSLVLLLAISGLVLLIACANLANLMLARSSAREREVAVRLAVGASRTRLIRQFLSESLLLAGLGAIAGAVLASNLSRFLVSFLTTPLGPTFVDLAPDWRVLAFTAGLAILTCVLFGLTPALRVTLTAPGAVMKASSRGLTAGRERFGLRRMLVISQVALSLVLLVGALLFVRSFRNLITIDAGFRQSGILEVDLDLMRLKIPMERRLAVKRELITRIQGIPGVDGAAQVTIVPLSGSSWNQGIVIGQELKKSSFLTGITPGYFRTMQIPMMAGRDFDSHDTVASPRVAIVNQAFAQKYLGGTNPIGKTFQLEHGAGERNDSPTFEIVGEVKDSKYLDIKENFPAIAYFSEDQNREPDLFAAVLVRSNAPLTALISAVKRTVQEFNPDAGFDFKVFQTQIQESLLRERLMATLSGFFGFLAVLLATIGLYGVISYTVARRRNEIGIRMALGADRREVVRLVLREAVMLVAIGLAAGTIVALASATAATSMLYGLKPHDPATLILAICALAVVAGAASYLPARRAAALDPMTALREE